MHNYTRHNALHRCAPLLALTLIMLLAACSEPAPISPVTDSVGQASPPATATISPGQPMVEFTPTPPPPVEPSPAAAAPSPPATHTRPAPSPTPTPIATPVAEIAPHAIVGVELLNVRAGPGVEYPVLGQALRGERYLILARDEAGDWWRIDFDGLTGWVFAPLTTTEGDVEAVAVLPDIPPPPPPAVQVYETTVTIPTYPYALFTEEAANLDLGWTFRRFDRSAYEASNPQPSPQTYALVVLENEYLRLTLLPQLGGRIYQAIFKPTGNNEFYQNPVIKPSPWGPPEQGGWLAAGGLEWGLPVEEHGYAWGTPWGHIILPFDPTYAGVTVFMPDEGHLRAEVEITLQAGEAAFTIQPRIVNPTDRPATYQFWLSAALAPGPANAPGRRLRFLFPTAAVTVHSRGDDDLPAAGQALSWPRHQDRDLSLLGAWNRWLGFFERPVARGPYAGVYDEDHDEGLIRVYPPAAMPGSKGFGLGWADPIAPEAYTDDSSAYVELHGGVTPTFWDRATLAAGAVYTWRERWFPVAGIGGVSYADGAGAIHLAPTGAGLQVAVFPVRSVTGRLLIGLDEQPVLQETVSLSPARPFRRTITTAGLPAVGRVTITLLDEDAAPVLNYAEVITLR